LLNVKRHQNSNETNFARIVDAARLSVSPLSLSPFLLESWDEILLGAGESYSQVKKACRKKEERRERQKRRESRESVKL